MTKIYCNIINRFEKIHLLRRIYCQKITAKSPLHFGQIPIMNYISENSGCTQVDIAEKLQVSAACIATSTKRLQKAGLITKTVDEYNLRCKRLSLTPMGKKVLEECHAPFDEYDRQIFRNISDEELESMNRIMDKLIYNMEEAIGETHGETDIYEIDRLIRRVKEEKNQHD